MEANVVPGPATREAQPVLVIDKLFKAFGDNRVLSGFNLTVKRGESVVVLGKSGSGKSVLIKCIIGLMQPDKGSIELLGTVICGAGEATLDKIRARVGFLFQSNALYDSMTVEENLEFPLRRHWMQLSQPQIEERVLAALSDVGLAHTLKMMPADLSGGMKKRIALARTLILKPEVILYDEPTTGLDPITGREITNLMMDIQAKYNTTSLIISHDINCVKIAGHRIIVLIDGKCYADGDYAALSRSTDAKVKQFFQ